MKILYVEDDILTLKNMKIILDKYCTELISCENYKDAIFQYENNDIDLVITDIEMPSKSGIDLIKYIRENNKTIPIVVQTAYRSHDYLFECINLNIQAYLYKPITMPDIKNLFEKINSYMDLEKNRIFFLDEHISYNFLTKQLKSDIEGDIELRKKELLLLELLINNFNNVVTFHQIEREIWESNLEVMTENSLRTIIKTIRKKIGKDKIVNLSGIGYKIIV